MSLTIGTRAPFRRRPSGGVDGLPAAPAASPAPVITPRPLGFHGRCLRGSHGHREESRQPAGAPLPSCLEVLSAWILLLDPLCKLAEPHFERPLDLHPRRARRFRPHPWPLGWNRVNGIGRLRGGVLSWGGSSLEHALHLSRDPPRCKLDSVDSGLAQAFTGPVAPAQRKSRPISRQTAPRSR